MPVSPRNRRAFPLARPRSTVFRAVLQHDEPNDLLPAPLARYKGGERRPHALSTAMRVTTGPWRPPAHWLSALVAGVASTYFLHSCCHAVVATACGGSGDLHLVHRSRTRGRASSTLVRVLMYSRRRVQSCGVLATNQSLCDATARCMFQPTLLQCPGHSVAVTGAALCVSPSPD